MEWLVRSSLLVEDWARLFDCAFWFIRNISRLNSSYRFSSRKPLLLTLLNAFEIHLRKQKRTKNSLYLLLTDKFGQQCIRQTMLLRWQLIYAQCVFKPSHFLYCPNVFANEKKDKKNKFRRMFVLWNTIFISNANQSIWFVFCFFSRFRSLFRSLCLLVSIKFSINYTNHSFKMQKQYTSQTNELIGET